VIRNPPASQPSRRSGSGRHFKEHVPTHLCSIVQARSTTPSACDPSSIATIMHPLQMRHASTTANMSVMSAVLFAAWPWRLSDISANPCSHQRSRQHNNVAFGCAQHTMSQHPAVPKKSKEMPRRANEQGTLTSWPSRLLQPPCSHPPRPR
jgi:hypothetical protein